MFIRIVWKPIHLYIIYVVSIQGQHCFASNKMTWQRIVQELCMCAVLFNSCDPMDYSLPGSSAMEFSKQEFSWGGLPFTPSVDLPDPGNPCLLHLLHWQTDSWALSYLGSHTGIIQEFNCQLWTWCIDRAVDKNIGNLISPNYFILCIEIIHSFSTSLWRQIMKQLFNRKKITMRNFS